MCTLCSDAAAPPSRLRAFLQRLPRVGLPAMLKAFGGPFTAKLSVEVVSTELVPADSLQPTQSTGQLGVTSADGDDIIAHADDVNANGKDHCGDRPDPGAYPMLTYMICLIVTDLVESTSCPS